jgi:hypothetical protein
MSKLADLIRKASRPEPAPLGFGAHAARARTATLLAIVRLSSGDANKAEEASKKGADAVIIEGADPGKVKDAVAKGGGLPVGVRPNNADRKTVSALRDAAPTSSSSNRSPLRRKPLSEKVSSCLTNVLMLTTGPPSSWRLGLDAMVIPSPPERLTLAELLKLRRVAALARVPLLVGVKHDSEAGYLHALRDSGVAGVLVDSSSLGKLGDLKARIESLPVRGRRREERAEAVLPAATPGHDEDFDDDD